MQMGLRNNMNQQCECLWDTLCPSVPHLCPSGFLSHVDQSSPHDSPSDVHFMPSTRDCLYTVLEQAHTHTNLGGELWVAQSGLKNCKEWLLNPRPINFGQGLESSKNIVAFMRTTQLGSAGREVSRARLAWSTGLSKGGFLSQRGWPHVIWEEVATADQKFAGSHPTPNFSWLFKWFKMGSQSLSYVHAGMWLWQWVGEKSVLFLWSRK